MLNPHHATSEPYAFEDFELDRQTGELQRLGTPVALRPLATAALLFLVERQGQLVARADLRRHLWGDQHLDFSTALNQCVRQIRRALGDDARSPRIIETVHRRGYRFIAVLSDTESEAVQPGIRQRLSYFAAGVGAAALAVASFVGVCVALGLS